MNITLRQKTYIKYIEKILNIKFEGTNLTDVLNFIDGNFQKAESEHRKYDTYFQSLKRRLLHD